MASTSTQTGNLLITIAASLAVCIAVARSMSYLSRRGGLSSSGQIKGNARGTGLLSRKNGLRTKIAQHHSPQKLSVSVACAEAKRGSQVVSAGSSKLEKVDKDNGELFDAIIFDMDGTLVSSTNLAHEATNTVLEEFGYNSITKHEYGQGTKYTTPVRLAWHAGIDDDDLAEKMGAAFDSSIIRLVTAENVPTFPGIKELLTEIRAAGIGMAVLSNASGKYVRRVNQAHSIAASFLVGLGADDVKRAKPSPLGLEEILREHYGIKDAAVSWG